jgi:hypothetical protein
MLFASVFSRASQCVDNTSSALLCCKNAETENGIAYCGSLSTIDDLALACILSMTHCSAVTAVMCALY